MNYYIDKSPKHQRCLKRKRGDTNEKPKTLVSNKTNTEQKRPTEASAKTPRQQQHKSITGTNGWQHKATKQKPDQKGLEKILLHKTAPLSKKTISRIPSPLIKKTRRFSHSVNKPLP
jgi:hypothetical protein